MSCNWLFREHASQPTHQGIACINNVVYFARSDVCDNTFTGVTFGLRDHSCLLCTFISLFSLQHFSSCASYQVFIILLCFRAFFFPFHSRTQCICRRCGRAVPRSDYGSVFPHSLAVLSVFPHSLAVLSVFPHSLAVLLTLITNHHNLYNPNNYCLAVLSLFSFFFSRRF
jgi:hypothetical protein